MYADDLVLLAENEIALQGMIEICQNWFEQWRLKVNISKTKVVHFKKPNTPKTTYDFTLRDSVIEITDSYKYLGIFVTEFLQFEKTANFLSDSARRAFDFVSQNLRI